MTLLSFKLYQQYDYHSTRNEVAVYRSSESAFAGKAIELWSQFNGEPREQIESSRMPVAIRFNDRTCVQLKTIPGSRGGLGGNPIYCFDNERNRLVYKEESVD
tara:strand:- start:427 stop:735 length:309 start_codon:yes stop_codon:yes gene_type:complete